MTRIITYFKLLLLSWLVKGKSLCLKIWNEIWSLFQTKELTEEIPVPTYINAKKYHSLFESHSPADELLVAEQVWDQIQSSLPQSYVMPNPDNMAHLQSMNSDSYNELFSKHNSSPQLFVDTSIWNRITLSLPQSYVLPNPVFEAITRPMSGKYYESLFSKPVETDERVFVDNKIWEPIKKNLPKEYSLPNPTSDVLFNAMDGNAYHPIISKELSKLPKTDEQIKEKIFNSLPKNYKIPNISFNKYPNTNHS